MTTTLNCLGWMQNQRDQNPCTTAQEVGQLCNAGYTVSLTNFEENNYIPNNATTNGCTCSWSIYNLLSACSYCFGQYRYTSWSTWVTDCGSYASDISYLPSGLRLSQGIPFWAATNPSTWENSVFNVTQAADIAAAAHSDVTGGPLPTPTPAKAASSASGIPVGAILGGVIGAIAIIIIGALVILWVMRRRRRTPTGVLSFSASHSATLPPPSVRTRAPLQLYQLGRACVPPGPVSAHLTSPIHSTTSLAAIAPLASPASSGFLSQGHSAALPLTDVADMISPFLAMSSAHQTNGSNTSQPTRVGKATEARSERVGAVLGQRVRMNPPPYSPSAEPSSSVAATSGTRRASTRKWEKRHRNISGVTTRSDRSQASTGECATTVHRGAGPRVGYRLVRPATPGPGAAESAESGESAGNTGGEDDDNAEATGSSGQHPDAA